MQTKNSFNKYPIKRSTVIVVLEDYFIKQRKRGAVLEIELAGTKTVLTK